MVKMLPIGKPAFVANRLLKFEGIFSPIPRSKQAIFKFALN